MPPMTTSKIRESMLLQLEGTSAPPSIGVPTFLPRSNPKGVCRPPGADPAGDIDGSCPQVAVLYLPFGRFPLNNF